MCVCVCVYLVGVMSINSQRSLSQNPYHVKNRTYKNWCFKNCQSPEEGRIWLTNCDLFFLDMFMSDVKVYCMPVMVCHYPFSRYRFSSPVMGCHSTVQDHFTYMSHFPIIDMIQIYYIFWHEWGRHNHMSLTSLKPSFFPFSFLKPLTTFSSPFMVIEFHRWTQRTFLVSN